MTKANGNAICAAIIGLSAIYATSKGDIAFAAPMFAVAVRFALWANREWKHENA